MFDFLKKKITGFVDKLTKKEEAKEEVEVEEIPKEEAVEEKPVEEIKPPEAEKPVEEKIEEPIPEIPKEKPKPKKEARPKPIPKPKEEKPVPQKKIEKPKPAEKAEKPKPKEKKVELPKKAEPPTPKKEPLIPKKEKPKPAVEKQEPEPETPEPETEHPKPETQPVSRVPGPVSRKPETEHPKPKTEHPEPETPKPETPAELPEYKEEKQKKKGISLSPFKAIKSLITREVEISESDVHELLENLELELLEADVELGVAESIRAELQSRLVGSKVKKKELDSFIKGAVRDTLVELMISEKSFDLLQFVAGREKPVKIVFFGLNGTGKTTSIAKVAHLLQQNDYKVVFAAADTFRAAAIEQMEVHAGRLDVKLIKRDYGADPTSVGYDAVSYAKAHGIDAVLIDTAGRQDTNINLINELKKMERVLKPELKLYIGESIAGSSVIEQVSTFNEEIGIDGVILTKLDCDPKGGTILSITKATGIPVIYIGTGQRYEDLERFDAEKIIDRLLT